MARKVLLGKTMKNNLNPLSASGTINRKTFFFTELILWFISGVLAQMAEHELRYMPKIGGMFVPIASIILMIYLTIAKANAEKNPFIQTKEETESVGEITPIESVDDPAPSHRSVVQTVSYGEPKRSLWDKLSGPLMILVWLAYLAYGLVALGLFGGFICWWLDIDNFLLEILAIGVGFIAVAIVPFAGWAVLAGSAYYAAEILRWGWPLAILFVFPGLGFMLLAGVGSVFSAVANKLRR